LISKYTSTHRAAALPSGGALSYFTGMKQMFALVILLLAAGLTPALAQADADDQYLMIYSLLQQADNLADNGQPQQALAQYAEVQTELQKFQKVFPDWNPNIVNFRLKYLAGKIADITAALPAPVQAQVPVAANAPVRPAAAVNAGQGAAPPQSDAVVTDLRNQLQQLQADNTTLAAKLKEALSVQPAAIDSRELTKAQQQIEFLTKENDLLKASLSQGKTRTNVVTLATDTAALKEVQAALVVANHKLADQTERADKLALENQALQSRVQTLMASPDALAALRAENDVLKKQIADLKLAAAKAPDTARIQDDERQAQLQLIAFQSQTQIWKLEKAALENKLKKSQSAATTTVAPVPVPVAVVAPAPGQAKYEALIQELTRERDDMRAQLGEANQKLAASSKKSASNQVAALADEVETLRGRLAVDEAQPVPYTAEELALFNAPAPAAAPVAANKPSTEMPAGSTALVVQAQSFFAQRKFGQAETNYLHVLEQDSNNVVVLGNLAVIEVEEGKLDEAETHLKAALALKPDDSYNLSRLGYLKFQQEKYDDALDSLGRAAKLDPQNPEIQNYLGVALSHKGLRVQAETALRKAIQLDPNYASAQNNLAVIYLTQKPPLVQLARWHYQKAVDAGQPRNPDFEKALDGETPAPNP
jgi:Flp pilus assembly protein TadD